jgi:hypothetical protein
MATERQLAANRTNAKRSTGPVTEAGKQASSQNALHHGILSHSCIILKGERADRFDALHASLIQEFRPSTPNEHMLIQTMAVARWRQVRNWTIQTATIELETANQDPEAGSPPVIAALAFRSLADNSQALHLLQRYDTALDRQYSRALSNLLKVRAARMNERINHPQAIWPELQPDPTPLNLVLEGTWASEPEGDPEPEAEFPSEPNLPEHAAESNAPETSAPASRQAKNISRAPEVLQNTNRPSTGSAPIPPRSAPSHASPAKNPGLLPSRPKTGTT